MLTKTSYASINHYTFIFKLHNIEMREHSHCVFAPQILYMLSNFYSKALLKQELLFKFFWISYLFLCYFLPKNLGLKASEYTKDCDLPCTLVPQTERFLGPENIHSAKKSLNFLFTKAFTKAIHLSGFWPPQCTMQIFSPLKWWAMN